jgi:hypothetical protein
MEMRCWLNVAAIAVSATLLGGCSRSGSPSVDQTKAGVPGTGASAPPAGPVNDDAKALAGFLDHANQYVLVHQKLENTLPKLSKESTPEQIDGHQRALAKLIQDARKDAKQGDIFTPDAQVVVKKLITKVFSGPDGASLKASIMDENPGVPNLKVNARYPDEIPVSTIPPQLLEGLPKLPEEMEYRFVGNDLILMDTHAHIIADFVPNTFSK